MLQKPCKNKKYILNALSGCIVTAKILKRKRKLLISVMQCGFAFLECGSVRSKNATNILIKNILDSCE